MLTGLLGIKWKIGAIGFGLSSIVLGVACFFLKVENSHLLSKNEELASQITVLKIDLDQSRKNTATLEAAVADQNATIEALAKESAERLAAAQIRLAEATKARRKAESRADALLNSALTGSTLELRVLEVDSKVLENLQ